MARAPSYFNVRTNPPGFPRSMASPSSLLSRIQLTGQILKQILKPISRNPSQFLSTVTAAASILTGSFLIQRKSLVLNKRETLMTTVSGVEKPKSLNETQVDFALLAKSAAVAKPEFPLDFFEKTICITPDVKISSHASRNGDSEGAKQTLASEDGFLESPSPSGFKKIGGA